MPCSITAPGHATNLTGVKIALARRVHARHALVRASVSAVEGERVTLELASGTIAAHCHDAERLDALLAAAAAAGHPAPTVLFTAVEHQLLVEVDPELHPRGIGTEYVAPSSSTGVIAAFNLALPWHPDVPCGRQVA